MEMVDKRGKAFTVGCVLWAIGISALMASPLGLVGAPIIAAAAIATYALTKWARK